MGGDQGGGGGGVQVGESCCLSNNNIYISSNRLKRRPRVAYEEGEFDIGKVLENPPDEDPQVVIETDTEDVPGSNNVIKRLQLNDSNKKLDVIMLN